MLACCTAITLTTDAITILKADHDKISKLFKEFDLLRDDNSRDEAEQIARQLCNELTVHVTVEEEIFYPEARAAIGDEELSDKAAVEHAVVKDLIAQIERMSRLDDQYAAKVRVLGRYIDRHVMKEDGLFLKARETDLDMDEVGARILARKHDLEAEVNLQDESDKNKCTPILGHEKSSSWPSRESHA